MGQSLQNRPAGRFVTLQDPAAREPAAGARGGAKGSVRPFRGPTSCISAGLDSIWSTPPAPPKDSVRGSSVIIGTLLLVQRRLAGPLRKDDTHKSRSINDFKVAAPPPKSGRLPDGSVAFSEVCGLAVPALGPPRTFRRASPAGPHTATSASVRPGECWAAKICFPNWTSDNPTWTSVFKVPWTSDNPKLESEIRRPIPRARRT